MIAAFQLGDGVFDLWSLPAPLFDRHMWDSRSQRSIGKVGLVRRDVFQAEGKPLGRVRV